MLHKKNRPLVRQADEMRGGNWLRRPELNRLFPDYETGGLPFALTAKLENWRCRSANHQHGNSVPPEVYPVNSFLHSKPHPLCMGSIAPHLAQIVQKAPQHVHERELRALLGYQFADLVALSTDL